MMLCFGIAKELGMSLSALLTTMTPEEIQGWNAYFTILKERRERAAGR